MKGKTALVNTAESPDQMKEKFKIFLRISPMFVKILKINRERRKIFYARKKVLNYLWSGQWVHSSDALQIAGHDPLVNCEIFFKKEMKEKNTRMHCI